MAKIRQEINIIDAIAGGASGVVLGINGLIQIDTTKYSGSKVYIFEAVVSTSHAASTLTLRRNGTATDDATINTTSTGRLRATFSTSPPAGQTVYGIYSSDTTIRIRAARVIILQTSSPLTDTETHIEVGNKETSVATSATVLASPKYWTYTSSLWDGEITAYFEACAYSPTTKTASHVLLQEDDGSFGWGAPTTRADLSFTNLSSTPTRTRSSQLTLTTGRHYRVAVYSATSKTAMGISNAKIVVQQKGYHTLFVEQQF